MTSRATLMTAGAIVSALTMLPAAGAFAESSVYTDLKAGCRSEEGGIRCKGPGGYTAVVADEGGSMSIYFGPTGKENNIDGLTFFGDIRGDKIEWRLADGKPYAAIVRIIDQANGREREQLLIIRITPSGSCKAAAIDAKRANANALARAAADKARRGRCKPA